MPYSIPSSLTASSLPPEAGWRINSFNLAWAYKDRNMVPGRARSVSTLTGMFLSGTPPPETFIPPVNTPFPSSSATSRTEPAGSPGDSYRRKAPQGMSPLSSKPACTSPERTFSMACSTVWVLRSRIRKPMLLNRLTSLRGTATTAYASSGRGVVRPGAALKLTNPSLTTMQAPLRSA